MSQHVPWINYKIFKKIVKKIKNKYNFHFELAIDRYILTLTVHSQGIHIAQICSHYAWLTTFVNIRHFTFSGSSSEMHFVYIFQNLQTWTNTLQKNSTGHDIEATLETKLFLKHTVINNPAFPQNCTQTW